MQEETNWGLIPRNVEVGQHISVPSQAPYSNVGISYDARKSVVPLTSGGPVDGTHDQEVGSSNMMDTCGGTSYIYIQSVTALSCST